MLPTEIPRETIVRDGLVHFSVTVGVLRVGAHAYFVVLCECFSPRVQAIGTPQLVQALVEAACAKPLEMQLPMHEVRIPNSGEPSGRSEKGYLEGGQRLEIRTLLTIIY